MEKQRAVLQKTLTEVSFREMKLNNMNDTLSQLFICFLVISDVQSSAETPTHKQEEETMVSSALHLFAFLSLSLMKQLEEKTKPSFGQFHIW